jgi:predicted GNAT family N-acyltransferase
LTIDTLTVRPARLGDGAAVFAVTQQSVMGLAAGHYSAEQIANWMGARTAAYYEDLIAQGRMFVAEQGGLILGFVDAEPGEVTRLFLRPDAAGKGLGARLLAIGIDAARKDHDGPIKIEATLNAESFYQRHGFRTIRHGYFSHGVGGVPIEIVHMELAAAG